MKGGHGEGIGALGEELLEGFVEGGVIVAREDIGQGLKHESALVEEGVGNLKVVALYLSIVI